MYNVIKQNMLFFVVYSILLLFSFICLIIFSKSELFLWINGHNHKFTDYFFYYVTVLGNGWMYLVALIPFLFIRFRYALIIILSALIQIALVNLIKQIIVPDALRPIRFFNDTELIHVVKNVNIHAYHSFPSGHSVTTFGVFTLFALFCKNKKTGIFLLTAPVLAAYSRVYLAQHFFADIVAGSLIGLAISTIVYTSLINYKVNENSWLDKKLHLLKTA